MKNNKSGLLSLILATAMTFSTAYESHSALSLVNGDFQDTSGLAVDVPNAWYGGVPASWTGVNGSFSVRDLSGNLLANLNVLSTTSPFVPLKQSAGLLDSSGIVSLSFDVTDLTGFGYSMSAGIFNTQNSTDYSNWIALALPPAVITTTGTQIISTAAAVSAGTYIGVAFWASAGAPGIDNVNVIPEPSAFSLMAAGSFLTFVLAARRRRQS